MKTLASRETYPQRVPRQEPETVVFCKSSDPNYVPSSVAQVEHLTKAISELREVVISQQFVPTETKWHLIKNAVEEGAVAQTSRDRFNSLVKQWREETAFASSVLEMAVNPAYQQIIGMGRTAVPFILQDLARKPSHWFWALKAITGEDPVPEQDKGNLPRMTQAWLLWGVRTGYEF